MEFIDKVMNVEVLNLPVGKAVLLSAALGLANGMSSTADYFLGGRIPPIALQSGIAAAISNIPFVQNTIGSDMTDLIAVAALTSGLNNQFNVVGKIVETMQGILPGGVAQPQPQKQISPETTEGEMSGYNMGQGNTRQLPNVDDVDLALLSARGYQNA